MNIGKHLKQQTGRTIKNTQPLAKACIVVIEELPGIESQSNSASWVREVLSHEPHEILPPEPDFITIFLIGDSVHSQTGGIRIGILLMEEI